MRRTVMVVCGSVAALAVIAIGVTPASAARRAAAPGKEFMYTGEVRASYSVVVSDTASEMTARSTVKVRYLAPLRMYAAGLKLSGEAAPFRQPPLGTIDVAITGRDRAGCEFALEQHSKPRMKLTVAAFPTQGPVRRVTKQVPARYALWVLGYPSGPLPKLTTSCNLDERINVLSLRELLEAAITFDPAETTLAGAWKPALGQAAGAMPEWPIVPLVYDQVWATAPPKVGSSYRLPAPVDKLAAGRPLTIRRSLGRRRAVPGAASVTVTTIGTITFNFKRKG
jgi:hypothetical protein